MRGGGRRPGGRGGGGGGGGRDHSPDPPHAAAASKAKDHQSSWRHSSYNHRSRRSPSPRRSPERRSPRRSPGRRSPSVERRDYLPRRPDHGKQQLLQPHPRGRVPQVEEEGFDFQHQYMLPDHPTDMSTSEVNHGLKPPSSRAMKDRDYVASSGVDLQGIQLQRSVFLDDGPIRPYYAMPPKEMEYDPLEPAGLDTQDSRTVAGGNHNLGIRHSEMPRYPTHLRDPYDELEKEKMYVKGIHYSVMPPSQPKVFTGASSSSFAKDEYLGFYDDRVGNGYGRSSISRYADAPLEPVGYESMQLTDSIRRRPLSPQDRDESRDYVYEELLSHRRRGDNGYPASDELYRKTSLGPRSEFRDTVGSSFMELAPDQVDRMDVSRNSLSKSSFREPHHALHGDAALDFHDVKGVREEYVGSSASRHVAYGVRSQDHELALYEETYAFARDVPVSYRERPESPLLSDRHMDVHGQSLSPLRRQSRIDDLGIYDLSPERMVRRKYILSDGMDQLDSRSILQFDQNRYQRMPSPGPSDEIWSNEEDVPIPHSKKMDARRLRYRVPSDRIAQSDNWLLSRDSSRHVEGSSGMSIKKRLRPAPSEFHGSYPLERRQNFFKPCKYWKRGMEDRHRGPSLHDGDVHNDASHLVKNDPPEGSEEFNQQVHKAFLRFSKLLNESPRQQKRFRDHGKSGSLLCCVCGSLSKEFLDTHSLVTHTYHSLKVGLKTEHLGFHKALCVLMGWNWSIAPDNSKAYQSKPVAEAKALKEDLILWPPVVIIHNSSIGINNNANGTKVVTVEGMEEILRGMGFGAGKTRVIRGKPANQSVLLVKFMPTFSGLQEAERLHKHYSDNKRGRREFQLMSSNSGSSENARVHVEKVEELLYGHMAIAGDLDKLDSETKKRCLVKSRKDIEAIADAPLNTD